MHGLSVSRLVRFQRLIFMFECVILFTFCHDLTSEFVIF